MAGKISRRGILGLAGAALASPRVWAQSGGVPIRFSLNLPRNGTNSPFIHALDRGYFAAEGVRIVSMDPAAGADAMQRVATETYDVSFADLPGIAEFHLRNPDSSPMAIFNVYRSTPASIVSWAGTNIRKPADLVGKTIGGPVTDNAFRLFPVFFRANGLDPQSVKFNNMDLRLREAVFMRREVDAITGFDSTIWLNLKGLGVKFEDISIMPYSAHGLDLYSNSILVSRKALRDHEAILPGLVRACLRGWRDAIANAGPVTDSLVRADGLVTRQIELERLEWVLKHQVLTEETKRGGLGDIDRARLQRSIEALAQGLQLPRVAPIEAIWTDKYLPPLADRRVA
jgi:NitT/TauT family transport system substrate-binding protein